MFRDDMRREEAAREARRQSSEEAVQSAFMRGLKPQLELVSVDFVPTPPSPRDSSIRGVEEAAFVPEGYRRFLTVSSSGELIEDALIAERLATDRYITNKRKMLDMVDPEVRLEVI